MHIAKRLYGVCTLYSKSINRWHECSYNHVLVDLKILDLASSNKLCACSTGRRHQGDTTQYILFWGRFGFLLKVSMLITSDFTGFGNWIRHFCNWIRPLDYWLCHLRYWIRPLGYWIRPLGNWIRHFGTKIRHDWRGFKKPATRLWMNLFRRGELHLRSKAVTGAGKMRSH